MTRIAAALWSRQWAGVLLALLVREILAPAQAAASCGDYVSVTHPSRPSGHASPHGPAARPAKPAPFPDPVPDDSHPPADTPCPGPSCSGDPALPAPPASTGQEGGEERWDCLLTPPTPRPAAAFGLPLEERPPRPFRLPASIFHPPRAADG
jgi:hypothetical protein